MDTYYGASICANGHVISSSSVNTHKCCTICGDKVYSLCENCSKPIQGKMKSEFDVLDDYNRPNYCYNCGEPYPWTSKILNQAVELIALDTELDDDSKELIKNALPDLLIDSPVTPIAVGKYKIGITKASKIVKDATYNLLVDVLSETAKKTFFE